MKTSKVMGITFSNQQIKLIKQKQSTLQLQLGECVVQNGKIHGNKGSYGYESLQFYELS